MYNIVQALQDDVETLQPNVNNIESTSQKLLSNADPNFAEELQLQVDILIGKWKKVVEGAKEQNVRLKDALEKSKQVRCISTWFIILLFLRVSFECTVLSKDMGIQVFWDVTLCPGDVMLCAWVWFIPFQRNIRNYLPYDTVLHHRRPESLPLQWR
jgi:hypothetical protein